MRVGGIAPLLERAMPDLPWTSKISEIKPVHNPVFTTADSLEDVIFEALIERETLTANRLRVLFGIYHNTLIKKLSDAQ